MQIPAHQQQLAQLISQESAAWLMRSDYRDAARTQAFDERTDLERFA